jgi:prevent-host-death family protein
MEVTYQLPRMTNALPVSIEAFRANLAHFVGRVVYGKERIIVRPYNRDAVVVLSTDEYQQMANLGKSTAAPEQRRVELKRMCAGLTKM